MEIKNISSLIGNTPLVSLQRLNKTDNKVFLKMEGDNPAGSVKDRAAMNMVSGAEKKGQIKPGDTIKVRDKSKKVDSIMQSMKRIKGDIELPWLELDKAKMTGTFLAVPERDEMALTINEQLVVELYSK